ncbi:MAG TPA: two-component regulator propeller domain-containing protein, partial [Candidatus Ozemobacteraceae bacterium]|nr:two-component regulator propeller domain-containing protein [Candidatus Ozemobacteraceae bacterium]
WDTSEGDDEKIALWIGTRNGITRVSRMGGVMTLARPRFTTEAHPFPWPGSPTDLQPIWAYSWYGNPIEDMNDVCPYDGLPGNDITCLALDDLNLYVGTNNGLCRIRK